MKERLVAAALVGPWTACAGWFVFFSAIGLATDAVLPKR